MEFNFKELAGVLSAEEIGQFAYLSGMIEIVRSTADAENLAFVDAMLGDLQSVLNRTFTAMKTEPSDVSSVLGMSLSFMLAKAIVELKVFSEAV